MRSPTDSFPFTASTVPNTMTVICCSPEIKFGTGGAVQRNYVYFHSGTKTGESGVMTILVQNDGSFRLEGNDSTAHAPVEEPPKEEVITPGKYRHFKGNEYEVTCFAKHSETGETLVIYRSLQDPGDVWARPYDMFAEYIWRDGKRIKRFEKI